MNDSQIIDQQTIDRVAAAIDSADIGHSMSLIRLVDGVSTYRLAMGDLVEEFTDGDVERAIDQVYARIREVKQRKQAEAVIAALTSAPGSHLKGGQKAIQAALDDFELIPSGLMRVKLTALEGPPCRAPKKPAVRFFLRQVRAAAIAVGWFAGQRRTAPSSPRRKQLRSPAHGER